MRWLSTAAVSILAAVTFATPLRAQSNPIVTENQQPGTSAWQLGDLYGRPYATDAAGQIKGYASATSVNKGGSINFHVSVNPAQTYTIDVYRIGWYQGLGGRLMQHIGPLAGVREPTCPTNASTGLIQCNWTPTYTLATQVSWTSGIYLAVLRNQQGFYNYIVFAVRDDSRVGTLLYQQPVTTYQAYNDYPDDNLTGKSLYEHNSFGANTLTGTKRAVKVSFDRPYAGSGAGQFLEVSEINTLRWVEKSGYDVTYSTNVDTHSSGGLLLNHSGFLSLPHDEYWSKPMYDAAIAARDAGVNLGFFGANSIFWQVRFEPSSSGVANRVMVCYKNVTLDPITDPNLKTVKWRDGPVNRPEQTLIGVQFTDGPNNGTAPYVVTNSGNWVYAGTGFTDGASVPGIVWYEADRLVSEDPPPVAVSGTYTLLSHSPYTGSNNAQDYANSSIYQALSGAWVFASGTMGWGWGLDDFYPEGSVDTVDVRIQRTTANILNRFLTLNLPPIVAAAAAPTAGSAPLTVTFSSTGSFDPEGQSLSYLWNFGDGTTSTAANPVHAFNQNGQYTVSLTVSDGQRTTSSAPLLIAVAPQAPQSLTFAQSKGAFGDADATTLTVQLTNVKAGSLIVAYVKWEGTAASTVALTDGISTFTADTLNSAANNDLHGRFFYLLSSSASGTVNYTATWSASRPYRKLLIYEYSYSGAVSFDASNRATATSGSLTAGIITTTGSDEVVFGAYGEYNANATTTERINGVAADQVLRASFASMWSKSFSSPFTGTATAAGNSATWLGNVIAFKRTSTSPPNTAPTISALGAQTIAEDTSTGALAFTVGDAETAAGSLTLSGGTSNATLVPLGNIVFGGSGASRTMTVTPAPNQSGTATITATVSDGAATAETSFLLTVTAANDLPTISSLAGQTTSAGVAVGPLAVTVGDIETAAGSLLLTGASSNPTLVPAGNIAFGGAGTSRTVTVAPAAGQTGTATITLTVNDGQATASTSFLLTVTATPPLPLTFAQSKGAFSDVSTTTLTVQLTNVKAGSLIVAYVKWEGTAASTVALNDGISTFTADALNSAANNDLHGRFFYLLSSSASGTVNYTATWSASTPYVKLLIYEYSYSGAVSFDASNRATATSGSLTTGIITTTGSDEIVFGAYGEYNANATTTERINGVAADQVLRASFASMWSKSFSSPFTGTATATGNSATWIGNVIAFRRN